jgi:peptidyl-prolyl cis-trans isomerase SurA
MKTLFYACFIWTYFLSPSSINQTLIHQDSHNSWFTRTVHAELVDRIVAIVNDEIITFSELQELMVPIRMRLQSMSDPIQRTSILRKQSEQALEQLIGQVLLIQQAEEQGIVINDMQTEMHLKNMMTQQGWGEKELQQYLSAQGITRTELKQQSKKFLLQQAVSQRMLVNKTKFSEAELQSAYQDYLTEIGSQVEVVGSHLFLAVPPGSDAAAEAAVKQQANALLLRIKQGENFVTLVKKYGQDPQASSGGDLGSIAHNSGLPKVLEDGFFALKTKEVGGPIRTEFGYHIIKANQIKKLSAPSFADIRSQLEMRVKQKKFTQGIQEWIEKLKEASFIERRL